MILKIMSVSYHLYSTAASIEKEPARLFSMRKE